MNLFYFHRVLKDNHVIYFGPNITNAVNEHQFKSFLENKRNDLIDWDKLILNPKNNLLALTFDDGLYDFLEVALPYIERFSVRVLLFITTGFISGECEPYEYVLADLVSKITEITDLDGHILLCKNSSEKEKAYQNLRRYLKAKPPQAREEKLRRLIVNNGFEIHEFKAPRMLSWDDVKYLSKHPFVDIGAHTLNHPLLTKIPLKDAWKEIKNSKTILENHLGKKIEYFAYPYGGYNFALRSMVKLAGMKYAFTTKPYSLGNTALPRIDGVQWLKDNKL